MRFLLLLVLLFCCWPMHSTARISSVQVSLQASPAVRWLMFRCL